MPITKEDCDEIQKELGTLGGATYRVKIQGDSDFRTICFRPLRSKGNAKVVDNQDRLLRCTQPAGRNTDHLGTGSCSIHGGSGKGAIQGAHWMTNGRSDGVIRRSVRNKINEYYAMSQGELRDLSFELATLKGMFSEIVDNMPEVDDEDFMLNVNRVQNLVGTIGTLVDKISRIESRDTLTVAQVLYLRTAVSDILMTYITDPEKRELAAKDLVQRVGGSGEYARVLTDGN